MTSTSSPASSPAPRYGVSATGQHYGPSDCPSCGTSRRAGQVRTCLSCRQWPTVGAGDPDMTVVTAADVAADLVPAVLETYGTRADAMAHDVTRAVPGLVCDWCDRAARFIVDGHADGPRGDRDCGTHAHWGGGMTAADVHAARP